MMKILFLNPHLHSSSLIPALRSRGIAALVCSEVKEADLVLKLHGRTVALVIGHDEAGVEFNQILKESARFKEMPVILTNSKWTEQQILQHQAGVFGANAYLRYPVEDSEFIRVAEEVLGRALARTAAEERGTVTVTASQVEWATVMINRPARASLQDRAPSAPEKSEIPAYQPEKTKVLSASEVAAVLKGGAPVKASSAKPIETPPSMSSPAKKSSGPMPLAIAEAAPAPATPEKPKDLTSVALSVMDSPSDGLSMLDLAAPSKAEPEQAIAMAAKTSDGSPVNAVPVMAIPITPEASSPVLVAAPTGEDQSLGVEPEFNLDALGALAPEEAGPLVATPVEAGTVLDMPVLTATPVGESIEDVPFKIGGDDDLSQMLPPPDFEATKVQAAHVVSNESVPTQATASQSYPASIAGDEEVDSQTMQDMPYLSKKGFASPLSYQQPLDDAIIPGGAVNAPDLDTLKRYLLLREQDVAALSNALRQAKDQVSALDQQLRQEKAVNTEFAHLVQEQNRRIENFEKEKEVALESLTSELNEHRFEMKKRTDKIRLMELQVRDATNETEKLKERVRSDIRKIRTREKELENRLEIMKKDSEALLTAREQKIIELKRKLDLLEFNMDLLQNQYEKEKQSTANLKEKLVKAAQVVRVAGGLLHPNETVDLSEILPEEGSGSDDKTSAA